MSTSAYPIYDTLPDASDHLRLLTLHGGDVSEPIRCTLRTVSFRDKPSYDALSYAWGDSISTKSINVDGFEIQVTANLEQALRHLRNVEHDSILWVDAVCINQSDASEKSHQVAFMGNIYRECAQVQIWLGCDSSKCNLTQSSLHTRNAKDESHRAIDPFELVRHFADDRHLSEWPCFHTQSDNGRNTIVYEANDEFEIMSEAFIAVAERAWWTRMWTVQEVILPKQGRFIYDTWSMSLQTFVDASKDQDQHFNICCTDAARRLPDKLYNILHGVMVTAILIYSGRIRDDYGNVLRFSLQRQHVNYGDRACKDRRDKVYGLLGIINELFLKPDYTRPIEEVFLRATCHMLSEDSSTLSSLTGPYYGPGPRKWASWVRQFDASIGREEGIATRSRDTILTETTLFDASDGHESEHVLLMGQPALGSCTANHIGLKVRGRRVGNVTFVSKKMDGDVSEIEKKAIVRQWMLDALDWDGTGMSADTHAYDDKPVNVGKYPETLVGFGRTLLGGADIPYDYTAHFEYWTRFTPAAMDWLEKFLSWVRDERYESELNPEINQVICIAIYGRCYFKAENNGQGLCFPNACVGDEVWVLDGSRTPFVLRPTYSNQKERETLRPLDEDALIEDGKFKFREDHLSGMAPTKRFSRIREIGSKIRKMRQSRNASQGFYHLMGDCYFDGFMHGEAMQNTALHEATIILV
jgi:hypothetical protein